MGKAAGTGMKSSRQNSRQNKIIIGNSTYKGKQAMLCSGRTAGGGVPTPAVLPVCYRLDYQAEKNPGENIKFWVKRVRWTEDFSGVRK